MDSSKEEVKELIFCMLEDLNQTQEELEEVKNEISNIKASKDDFNLIKEEVIDDKYEKLQGQISKIEALIAKGGELDHLSANANSMLSKRFILSCLLFGIVMCTICFTIVFDNTIFSTILFILTVSPFLFTLYLIYSVK